MRESSRNHPIRRIRQAFNNTPDASGLRDFHTAAGFAVFLGRAASTIRNVESGQTKRWDRLARHIEATTGVSAEWMLSKPEPSQPIIGVDGKPWNPEEHLDFLGGATAINWRLLLQIDPQSTVNFAGRLVERKLSEDLLGDLKEPETSFLNDLIQLLKKHGFVNDDELAEVLHKTMIGNLREAGVNLIKAAILKREKG